MSAPTDVWLLPSEYADAAKPVSDWAGDTSKAVHYRRADIAPVWHRMDDPASPPPMDGTRHLLGFGDGAKFSQCRFVMVAGALGWLEAFSRTPAFPTHWRRIDAPPAPAESNA